MEIVPVGKDGCLGHASKAGMCFTGKWASSGMSVSAITPRDVDSWLISGLICDKYHISSLSSSYVDGFDSSSARIAPAQLPGRKTNNRKLPVKARPRSCASVDIPAAGVACGCADRLGEICL